MHYDYVSYTSELLWLFIRCYWYRCSWSRARRDSLKFNKSILSSTEFNPFAEHEPLVYWIFNYTTKSSFVEIVVCRTRKCKLIKSAVVCLAFHKTIFALHRRLWHILYDTSKRQSSAYHCDAMICRVIQLTVDLTLFYSSLALTRSKMQIGCKKMITSELANSTTSASSG